MSLLYAHAKQIERMNKKPHLELQNQRHVSQLATRRNVVRLEAAL